MLMQVISFSGLAIAIPIIEYIRVIIRKLVMVTARIDCDMVIIHVCGDIDMVAEADLFFFIPC